MTWTCPECGQPVEVTIDTINAHVDQHKAEKLAAWQPPTLAGWWRWKTRRWRRGR